MKEGGPSASKAHQNQQPAELKRDLGLQGAYSTSADEENMKEDGPSASKAHQNQQLAELKQDMGLQGAYSTSADEENMKEDGPSASKAHQNQQPAELKQDLGLQGSYSTSEDERTMEEDGPSASKAHQNQQPAELKQDLGLQGAYSTSEDETVIKSEAFAKMTVHASEQSVKPKCLVDYASTSLESIEQNYSNDSGEENTNKEKKKKSPSSEDSDEENVCIPRLRRTKSVMMRESVPEESEELFDSGSGSGEEYVPNFDDRSDSFSDTSSSQSLRQCSQTHADQTLLQAHDHLPDSTTSDAMDVGNKWSQGGSDLNVRSSTSSQIMEHEGATSNPETFHKQRAVMVSAVKKKCDGGRIYNKRHYCLYCLKPVSKMARHLTYVHSKEREVHEACKFPKGSKQRKMHLDDIRHRGNFVHNAAVLKSGEGELVPYKQPKNEVKGSDFMHCAYCQGLFTRKVLWRHVKVCKLGPKDFTPKPGKNRVQSLCAFSQPVPSNISKTLWKALSLMKADEITSAVKNDSCIIQLGEHLLNKGGPSARNEAFVRQKLRELGKLLISGGKIVKFKDMEDFLDPLNYMKTVEAVRSACGYNVDTNTFRVPSLAKKLGISLMKLSKLLKAKALIEKNHNMAEKLSDFQEIHKERWCELISATAARNIAEAKWNAPLVLPFTKDVQKLHVFLSNLQDKCTKQLSSESSSVVWSELTRVVLAQIILFNRRREGEVSSMPLSLFLSRDTTEHHDDVDWALSQAEKNLCRHFTRIVIRGKRGRPVPILLTPKMLSGLEVLVEKRSSCGVLKDNAYLFARPSALSHYRASDCIRSFAQSCGAKNPETLTSTKLRKQVATLSTVLNLRDTDLDQLANFLGHDVRIHREYYRLPEKTLQLAKISKILMAIEQGRIGEFKGKNLDEINIEPNEEIVLNLDERSDEQQKKDFQDSAANASDSELSEIAASEGEQQQSTRMNLGKNSTSNGPLTVQRKRKAWEMEEVQAVERHMKTFITSCRVPGKRACENCLRAEPSALKNRDWQSVKFFIYNRIVAYKRDLKK